MKSMRALAGALLGCCLGVVFCAGALAQTPTTSSLQYFGIDNNQIKDMETRTAVEKMQQNLMLVREFQWTECTTSTINGKLYRTGYIEESCSATRYRYKEKCSASLNGVIATSTQTRVHTPDLIGKYVSVVENGKKTEQSQAWKTDLTRLKKIFPERYEKQAIDYRQNSRLFGEFGTLVRQPEALKLERQDGDVWVFFDGCAEVIVGKSDGVIRSATTKDADQRTDYVFSIVKINTHLSSETFTFPPEEESQLEDVTDKEIEGMKELAKTEK
jgi:outer membrane lipoprotein-sorting protein